MLTLYTFIIPSSSTPLIFTTWYVHTFLIPHVISRIKLTNKVDKRWNQTGPRRRGFLPSISISTPPHPPIKVTQKQCQARRGREDQHISSQRGGSESRIIGEIAAKTGNTYARNSCKFNGGPVCADTPSHPLPPNLNIGHEGMLESHRGYGC